MQPAPRARILIVDDRRANMLALAAVLEDEYELLFAESGEQAVETVRSQRVDLILMDVQMPGMDGFEAAASIKALDGGREIPIVFVTAVYREDPFVRKGYEAGGIDYFAKPFDPQILKMKVAVYCAFRLRERTLRERELHVREAEELLRVGRRLSAVLESLPVGVLIADVEGRICQVTEQAMRILRCAEAASNGSYGELLAWWDSAGRLIRDRAGPLARALDAGETSHSAPLVVHCFDGTRRTILASVTPLRGLAGERVGAVALLQDPAHTQEIERALAERVARLVSLGVEIEESAAG